MNIFEIKDSAGADVSTTVAGKGKLNATRTLAQFFGNRDETAKRCQIDILQFRLHAAAPVAQLAEGRAANAAADGDGIRYFARRPRCQAEVMLIAAILKTKTNFGQQ